VAAINGFIKLTLRNKAFVQGPQQIEHYHKIVRVSKALGFPQDFFKKGPEELFQYMRSKDFLVLLRVRVH